MSKVAYVATPITDIPQMNIPMVCRIVKMLKAMDVQPVIPHDIPPWEHTGPCPQADTYPGVTGGGTHGGLCYLRQDLIVMLGCDFVVMAPGWSRSRGATAEHSTARAAGLPVAYYFPVGPTDGGAMSPEPVGVDSRQAKRA